MPDNTVDLLFRFLQQNGGRLSRHGRQNEFAQFTDDEAAAVEEAYAAAFSAMAHIYSDDRLKAHATVG
jgi:hypothetical protein